MTAYGAQIAIPLLRPILSMWGVWSINGVYSGLRFNSDDDCLRGYPLLPDRDGELATFVYFVQLCLVP